MLAAQEVKHEYRWVVGNGEKIHFLEDTWFDTDPCNFGIYIVSAMKNQRRHLKLGGWGTKTNLQENLFC
jgi:ubiquinone/menaquinone biosynthesis C-methylase UbiE